MKLITAIVNQEKLDEVTRAAIAAGARGMTVAEVRGFGQQYGNVPGQPAEYEFLALPKPRIDVVVEDLATARVVSAIAKASSTGTIGDGKIWVCPVDSVLRVSTGERDDAAI